jgi:metallo-beta-lactamase class B
MLKRLLAGFAIAASITGFHSQASAQRGGAAQDPDEPTEQQMAESKEAQRHIAAAMAIAKETKPDLVEETKVMCTNTGPRRPAVIRQLQGLPAEPQAVIEPTKLFDNLYYFGFNTVGGWAITTSDGIIIVDTLNSEADAVNVLVPSLQKLGLDPAQIKYVIVQHGHFDHFGGAQYLQQKYNAKVLMATEDWNLIEGLSARQRRDRALPRRDIEVKHGQQLTLGDTTVTMALTPGHTPGSIALFFPIKDRGKQHTAMILSLTTPDRPALAALERAVNDFAKKQKAALRLTSHLSVENIPWLETIRKNPNGPNPYLYSEERFDKYMDIMVECARARVAALGR